MKKWKVKYVISLLIFNAVSLFGFAQEDDWQILNDSTIKISGVVTNTIRSDFGPVVVGDTLCFTSYSDKILGKPDAKLRKDAFYDLYHAKIDKNGNTISQRQPLIEFLTQYHDGPVSYCAKTGELFITQSDNVTADKTHRASSKDTIRLRIVIAKRVNGKWTSITNFPYNNPSFSLGHPSISQTGDTLIFSSDRHGGFGETDLYYSIRKKGKWGLPVNLGAQINTSGKEEFSFIYQNSTGGASLIFASNGRFGYGGLDLYYTRFAFRDNEVEHFDEPINTPFDDFGMVIPFDAGYGYMTSNRPGKGNDDIYRFTFKKLAKPTTVPLLAAGTAFPVKELYVFNKKTRNPISSVVVRTCDNQSYLSDQVGEVALLTKQNGDCEVVASKTGYGEIRKILVAKPLKQGEVNRDTIWLEPATKEKITLKNIYYDYAKWDILPDAAKELDLLVAFMNENPELKVQLSSHTDSRSDNLSNLWLSQKRADAAVNYVISHGIDAGRITGVGYGETQLLNHCKDGVNCTAQEHRQNRRTEIYIPEYGKAQEVVQTEGQYAGRSEQARPAATVTGNLPNSDVLFKKESKSAEKTESRGIETGRATTAAGSDKSTKVKSTNEYYVVIRSFQTKAFAEKYLVDIKGETPGAQVIGESTPFRVGIRQTSYESALEVKSKYIEKYPDCWILR